MFKSLLKKLFNRNKEDDLSESYNYITEADIKDADPFSDEFRIAKTFTMNAVEKMRYEAFCKAHRDCVRDPKTGRSHFGTIGGGIVVSFMGTGLGDCISVKCERCGHHADITDNTHW